MTQSGRRQDIEATGANRVVIESHPGRHVRNMAIEQQYRAFCAVAVLNQNYDSWSCWHASDGHRACVGTHIAEIHAGGTSQRGIEKFPTPATGIASLPNVAAGETGNSFHAGLAAGTLLGKAL